MQATVEGISGSFFPKKKRESGNLDLEMVCFTLDIVHQARRSPFFLFLSSHIADGFFLRRGF